MENARELHEQQDGARRAHVEQERELIMGWFTGWFGYGLGAGAAKAIFGEKRSTAGGPVRNMTEAEIRADEKRFDEDAKRLDAEDAAAKRS
jgi:hypothetical protein